MFLAFVRTAHYWTKLHSELTFEDDLRPLLARHQSSAECLFNDPEAGACEVSQKLMHELTVLREAEERHHDLAKTHEALRESELRFRGIFNQTLVGIAETDLAGRFVNVNPRYCEIVGRSAEELCGGMRMQDITHPDDLRGNLPLFEKAVQEGLPFLIEKRYILPDGAFVWVSNSVSVIKDPSGQVVNVAAVLLDITERKQAESQLRDSELFYRQTLESIPGMVFTNQPDGSWDYVSQQWVDFTGILASEQLGSGWVQLGRPG